MRRARGATNKAACSMPVRGRQPKWTFRWRLLKRNSEVLERLWWTNQDTSFDTANPASLSRLAIVEAALCTRRDSAVHVSLSASKNWKRKDEMACFAPEPVLGGGCALDGS